MLSLSTWSVKYIIMRIVFIITYSYFNPTTGKLQQLLSDLIN